MSTISEMWIVDRFEGPKAVLERDLHDTFAFPRALLPAGADEGDVLRVVAEGGAEAHITIARDAAATAARRDAARAALDALRRRPGA